MKNKALTHALLLGAKPKDAPYKLSDLDRLYILVAVAGKKYWKWNYRLDGKDYTYTIGTFPQVGIAEARQARANAEKLVAQGIHPADHEADTKLKNQLEKANSLWSVAADWINHNRSRWSPGYRSQVETYLGRYVRDGEIGKRPIRQISTPEIYALIESVSNRSTLQSDERKVSGAPAIATLLRQWCLNIFRYAIISGRAERNPVADLKASDVIVRPPVKNNRALKPAEIQALLEALISFSGQRSTAIAIRLLMLTFVRTKELRGATWDEFDLANRTWTIPAHRMKIKTAGDHLVPLSSEAVTLLEELKTITGVALSGPQWLFPNTRRPDACMSATTINRALERLGFNGPGTIGFAAHGFRGTASTRLHELGFPSHVIEVQLAHKEKNGVKAAYNKAQYVEARTEMMQRWADFIAGQTPLMP